MRTPQIPSPRSLLGLAYGLFALVSSGVAWSDTYCVAACEPGSLYFSEPKPFKCDTGSVGGEAGKFLCGVWYEKCSIQFFDNQVCGSGNLVRSRAALFDHTVWVIAHEGCGAWVGDAPVPIADFRHCYDQRQSSAITEAAKFQVKTASDEDVRAAITAAAEVIPGKYDLPRHFSWFCKEKGHGSGVHEASARGDWPAIRRSYHETQIDNPDARALLNAVKDSDIGNIYVRLHCPA